MAVLRGTGTGVECGKSSDDVWGVGDDIEDVRGLYGGEWRGGGYLYYQG